MTPTRQPVRAVVTLLVTHPYEIMKKSLYKRLAAMESDRNLTQVRVSKAMRGLVNAYAREHRLYLKEAVQRLLFLGMAYEYGWAVEAVPEDAAKIFGLDKLHQPPKPDNDKA